MDLKEEEALGGSLWSHWYYLSKARAMLATLPRRERLRVLDVGAGSGFFSRWLLENGVAESAVCVDPGYPEDREESVAGKPLSFVRTVDQADVTTVLMMDVLEHVDDDAGLVAEYLAKIPAGTDLLITVPAFEFIWSAHDDFLEHRRRYTLRMLEDTLSRAGAESVQMHYYFGAIFPLAAAIRLATRGRATQGSDMKPQNPLVNQVLLSICALERQVMAANRLAGLSVICAARKAGA